MKKHFAVLPLLLLGLGIYSGQAQQSTVTSSGSSASVASQSNTVAGIALGGVRLVHGITATSYGTVSAAAISNANLAAVAGDIVDVGPGTVTLSNKLTVTPGVTIRGVGDATEIQGWVLNQPQIIITDNSRVERLRITSMLAANSAVGGAAIGVNSGAGDSAPTNAVIRYITATNWNYDSLYVAHTNRYDITVEDSDFWSRWDAGAIFPSQQTGANDPFQGNVNSLIICRRSRFRCINQTSGNSAGDAHAFWAAGGGSNFLDNCVFEVSGTPTNSATGTNNYALAFQSFNGSGCMVATGCRMTASGPNPHSLGNLVRAFTGAGPLVPGAATWMGVTNNLGLFSVSGCSFDSTTVTGVVQVLSLPAANGYTMVDNTNILIVFNAGQSDVDFFYTNSGTGNLPIAGVPGYASTDGGGSEIWRSTNVWKMVEPFGTIYYTNNAVQPTNDAGSGWKVFDGGATPVPTVRWDRYSTNAFTSTDNVSFSGQIALTRGITTSKNNGAAPTSITVGASVFNYTNTQPVNIQLFFDANGATTALTFNGSAIYTTLVGSGDHTIIMQPGDRVAVTYSIATPIMKYREF